jgi:heme exporter protein D
VYAVILLVFWVRGTLPRLRIDQLMAFAWKVMVPLAFYTIVITAIYLFYDWPAGSLTLMSLAGLVVVGYLIYHRMMAPVRRVAEIRARQQLQMAQRAAAQRSSEGRLANVK